MPQTSAIEKRAASQTSERIVTVHSRTASATTAGRSLRTGFAGCHGPYKVAYVLGFTMNSFRGDKHDPRRRPSATA